MSREQPLVTIVVPSHNGLKYLKQSIPTYLDSDFPQNLLEIIVVDNASSDETPTWVSQQSSMDIIRFDVNKGFAPACNHGAMKARSPFVAFLNNDLKVDRAWLKPLVDTLETDEQCIAAGSKVLSWDGKRVDFAGGDINFEGRAFQRDFRRIHEPERYETCSPIFLNGGAMLVRRDRFLEIGGFDEDFFAYYEDVDFGWRAWLLGHTLRWIPDSVTYHHHGATSARMTTGQKRYLLERNALLSMYKNYESGLMERTLSSALILSGLRMVSGSDIHQERFILSSPSAPQDTIWLKPEAAAHLAAVDGFVRLLPRMKEKRAFVQQNRTVSDQEILRQFGKPFEPIHPGRSYARVQESLIRSTGLRTSANAHGGSVLLISPDILPLAGLPTTGAGLRAWGMGQGLKSKGFTVHFSMPKAALRAYPHVESDIADLAWDENNLSSLVSETGASVVVACGWPLLEQLSECPRPIALDFHGPHLLERTIQKHLDTETNIRTKIACISRADFYSCAGDRQRSYFIPWLLMAGVPYDHAMIHHVPVCVSPDLPPRANDPKSEPIFVYGGVFLPWQDPRTSLTVLVEELERAGRGYLHLYGGRHPFIPLDTARFESLVKTLESSERVVSHGMVTHDRLLEAYSRATVAMDIMTQNPERELAFTTRTVEYLWCGLPVLYNDYADLAHLINQYDAGWTIDPGDSKAIRRAIREVLQGPDTVKQRSNNAIQLVRNHLTWETAVDPLAEFCKNPAFRSETRLHLSHADMSDVATLNRAIYDKDVHIRNLEAMLAKRSMFKRLRYYQERAGYHFTRGGIRGLRESVFRKIREKFGRNPYP